MIDATRRTEILLWHYRDVCERLFEEPHGVDPTGNTLMCWTWNHPAYQELERLLKIMHQRWPVLRQAIRVRYERYTEVRVAWCKKCGAHNAEHIGSIHRHPPGRSIGLKPRTIRRYGSDDSQLAVDDAIEWLSRHWREVYSPRYRETSLVVPRLISQIEAERELRKLAA